MLESLANLTFCTIYSPCSMYLYGTSVFLYVVSLVYTTFRFLPYEIPPTSAPGCILNFDELIKQSGIISLCLN